MNYGRNEEHQGLDVSRRIGQAPAHGDGMGGMSCEDFCGYIFMCNGRTKPECYMYRVFGLPAGRREFIEKIRPGMKLFLFDYEVKYLYGVYEATTSGRLNWEATAFGGKFPAQVRFHIYKECLPLAESWFKHAIRDNYQTGSNKFNPVLSGQQVSHLLSLFSPLTKPSSAICDQYPVKDQFQSHSRYNPLTKPPSAIYGQYPIKDQFQSHSRLPPQSYPYVDLINSSHAPQASLPQYTQMNVLQPEHTGHAYAAKIGFKNPAVQPHDNSAQYQTSYQYPVKAGHPYLPEVPKSYERYEVAAQAVIPTHQYPDWRYGYNQLSSQTQTQMQGNAAQHQSFYQVPESHHVAHPIEQQHALTFKEHGPDMRTLPISSSNTWSQVYTG